MRVLVTGGEGFLGSRIARELARLPGFEVWRTGRGLRDDAAARTLRSTDAGEFSGLGGTYGLLIHAAFAGATEEAVGANERISAATIARARRSGVGRAVLLSTGSVYAPAEEPGGLSEAAALRTDGEYALAAQRIERAWAAAFDDLAIARLFYPYGPGQRAERLIPRLAAKIRAGEEIAADPRRLNPIFGDDAADAIARLARSSARGVFNVAGRESASIGEIVRLLASALGKNCRVSESRTPAEASLVGSTKKLRDLIGDFARIGLDEGFRALANPLD